VKSAVSYVLGDNIENLTLLGGKSVDATGNGLDNTIVDNKGDNVLKGMGGTDILIAGVGNDTMTGGSGTDFFEFNKGTHHDIITDFKNGKDVISSSFVSSDADAAALLSHHAHQDGNDVLISFGHDSVLIKHMDLSALDSADFFYF
jgi:Ca2+-binding RTX toxin-like protein